MRRILHGLSLIITLLPFSLKAQDATPLSLDDAINYGLKNNVNVKNAQLDVLIQRAKNAEVTALALPRVNAEGQYMDYFNPMKSFVPGEFIGMPGTFVPVQFTPKYNVTASGTASQVLFDGSVLVALQAKRTVISLFEQSEQLSKRDLKYNIQKAYYNIVIAHRQFDNLKRGLSVIRSMAADLEVMKDNGFVEKIELDRTNVQVNNFMTDSIRIASILEISEQALKYQMGMDIDRPIVLTDTSLDATLTEAMQLINEEAEYEKVPEFGLLRTQLKLNEYDLRRYKLNAIPTLAAFTSAGYNFSTNEFDDVFKFRKLYQFNSFWGVKLTVPIFNGLQRVNQVKQAKFNVQKAKNNLENMKLALDFQTKSAKTTLKNSSLTMKSQERNLELAESVVDLAQKKYKAGVGSNLEVNSAQTELLDAQSNYYQSLLEVINAQADLQKALGEL